MTIGIVGAMEEEISLIRAQMTQVEETEIANSLFITGDLVGKNVVLLKSGIGKVNAAMSTTIMLERFRPDQIINTGSAGGTCTEQNVGDLVISTSVLHHDVDATAFDYVYGQVPKMPARFESDVRLATLTKQVATKLNIPWHEGVIATGDGFMNNADHMETLLQRFPDVIAVEMEAAAIAQVCFQYNAPFVVIRALSDNADNESSVSFEAFLDKAASHAASLVFEVVPNM